MSPEGPDTSAENGGIGVSETSNNAGANSEYATGNWLVMLASVLGKTAGKHLKAMLDTGERIGALDSKEDPELFAQYNAEFQAEAQMFKIVQESISTMVKSIGEGMSTVARKS